VISKERNEGIASAYRTAITHATGDVLMFLDADDIAMPERATKVADAFTLDPDVGFVYSKLDLINSVGQSLHMSLELPKYLNDQNLFMYLFRRGYFTGSGMAIRNEKWVRFDLDLICCDYFLTLQFAARNYGFIYIDETLTQYRIHQSNTSNQANRMKTDVLKAQAEFSLIERERMWTEKGHSRDEISTTIGINQYYFAENYEEAERSFLEVKSCGGNEESLFYLGYINFVKGDLISSLDYFNRANCIKPDRFQTVHNLGVLLAIVNGDRLQSLELLQKARRLQPLYLLIEQNEQKVIEDDVKHLKLIHFLADQDAINNSYCRLKGSQ
jgi:glycosyltransferase involved in cell wall biosynthesis